MLRNSPDRPHYYSDWNEGDDEEISSSRRSLSMTETWFSPTCAAYTAVALFGFVAVIQLLIAAGLIPIHIIWKASFQELTLALRLESILAALVLLSFGWIVWNRYRHPQNACQNWPSFLVTAYMALNTVGNWLSTDPVERYIFGSITLVLAACCFRVSTTSVALERQYQNNNNGDHYHFSRPTMDPSISLSEGGGGGGGGEVPSEQQRVTQETSPLLQSYDNSSNNNQHHFSLSSQQQRQQPNYLSV